jgi:hypothetical protein
VQNKSAPTQKNASDEAFFLSLARQNSASVIFLLRIAPTVVPLRIDKDKKAAPNSLGAACIAV